MATELAVQTPQQVTGEAIRALQELKGIIANRPPEDKLVLNKKQYLFFYDLQMLGAFFHESVMVTETKTIEKEVPSKEVPGVTLMEFAGYWARAKVIRNGEEVSAAEAVCFKEEKNWANKDRFQLLSMAQTRACAKALRNRYLWVIKLPAASKERGPIFAEETAEEIDGKLL